MKKHIVAAFLLGISVVISAAQPSMALPLVNDTLETAAKTVEKTEGEVKSVTDQLALNRAEVEAKRQAIEQKVAEKKSAIAQKLSGQREEKCEKREANINSVLDNRTSAAQRHFDTFERIHNKLLTFVAEKELAIEDAKQLENIMNTSAVDAQAAIDAVESIDFACEEASASSPGGIVMEQVAAAKQALKDYRTSIKDYAIAVKGAAAQAQQTETTTEEAAQ